MTRAAIAVDIDELPEIEKLATEVGESGTPRILRRGGEEIAIVRPLPPADRRRPRCAVTEEAYANFRSAAGGWAGLVDGDELIRQIYADREIDERPPVEL
jgi:hypothetical protein